MDYKKQINKIVDKLLAQGRVFDIRVTKQYKDILVAVFGEIKKSDATELLTCGEIKTTKQVGENGLLKFTSKANKEGITIEYIFYDAVKCKLVGTEKKTITRTKEIKPAEIQIIKPAETIMETVEVETPIWECPKGEIIK